MRLHNINNYELLIWYFNVFYIISVIVMKYLIGIFAGFVTMISVGFAHEYILFYGNGCSHCAQVEQYLKDNAIQEKFDLKLKEVYFNRNNLTEFQWYLTKLQLDTTQIGVPFLVINNEHECKYINGSVPIVDFFQKKMDMMLALEQDSIECNTGTCGWLACESQTLKPSALAIKSSLSWEIETPQVNKISSERWKFFAIMMPAALSDSINPCAFAVMLLLLSTILSRHQSRRKTLLSWAMFALAVFVSYFAMWIWLFSALANANNTFVLKLVVWVLWIVVWLANLKDFFRYGKWFVMEVPMSRRPKLQDIIHKVSSPWWAFAVGLLVSLFLLPCSSGPYFTILWYLSSQSKELHTRWYIYLLIYNILFILPMLIIAILVSFGWASVDKLAKIKHENTKLIHLIVWLLMLWLWVYVLVTI